MSIEISDCLKRERDICVKTIMPDQNMAFRRTPTLIDSIVISLTWLSTYISADRSEPLYFSTHAKEKSVRILREAPLLRLVKSPVLR